MPKTYPVNEIFSSIQGEGAWTGIPATFIRFQGCNLRCSWCDTKETWSGPSQLMTPEEILELVHYEHVIITGGEPLLHDLTDLLPALARAGRKIHIETNGTIPWKISYPQDIWLTVSPKIESNYKIDPSLQKMVSEYKFVVDEAFNPDIIADFPLCPGQHVFLSPENVRKEMIAKALEITFKYPHCRLMLQLHKIIDIK